MVRRGNLSGPKPPGRSRREASTDTPILEFRFSLATPVPDRQASSSQLPASSLQIGSAPCRALVRYFLRSHFLLSRTIDFYPDFFHQLTNPSSRNSFLFSSIQNPGGCRTPLGCFRTVHCPLPTIHFHFSRLRTLCLTCKTQLLCFQGDADSLRKIARVWSLSSRISSFAFRVSTL
jgi:hypothetical protein